MGHDGTPKIVHSPKAVAVIGAGPAGIVTSKFLIDSGFESVIFESSSGIGGQWNISAESTVSAVWPEMRMNTPVLMTNFSDLQFPKGTPIFPTGGTLSKYLNEYAAKFGIDKLVQLNSVVEKLDRSESGEYTVVVRNAKDSSVAIHLFTRVVVCVGRHHGPIVPTIPDVGTFTGTLGVNHAQQYKNFLSAHSDNLSKKKIVVVGSSISAVEITSDLAERCRTLTVISSARRQRYVIPKISAGVPASVGFATRMQAILSESLPFPDFERALRKWVVTNAGNPSAYGAPAPITEENIFAAGISQSQSFLPLVAEGRISCRSNIGSVNERTVIFTDGTEEHDVDGIMFATGYNIHVPFLSETITDILKPSEAGLLLDRYTFNPSLPGLAFVGMYDVIGPYFPALELNARWVSAVFAGTLSVETEVEIKPLPPMWTMQNVAILFSRALGTEPDFSNPAHLKLARRLLFGPLTSDLFRLSGPDSLDSAAKKLEEESIGGQSGTAALSDEEKGMVGACLGTAPASNSWMAPLLA
ncbi:flavin-containing monooxygenase 2 [Cladochytrium replicatum]|nr:flavin-containing monooxygenase 2 [Cladochytrium replicatum]